MKNRPTFTGRYARRDWLIAILLALIVLGVGLTQLTRGVPEWGDDFAAYISEGIAIADGELAEQAQRNYFYHPTDLPAEADSSGLVYVWGYPLLLSLVYRCVGFDMQNYTSVIYYKLPSLICLSLTAGVLYLLMKRRCSRKLSAVLALVFCMARHFISFVNNLYSDICFMFFSTLTLLLLDLFLYPDAFDESGARRGPTVPLGIALGAALWYSYETRLNGIALIFVALFAQLLFLMKRPDMRTRGQLARHILPYIVFLALRFIFERLLFLPATSNMSDLAHPDLFTILRHTKFYITMTLEYIRDFSGMPALFGILLCIPCAIGFFGGGLRRENLHLTLLFLGTYVILLPLPYTQGLRYLYHILPILTLYLAYGIQQIYDWFAPRLNRKLSKGIACVLGAALLCASLSTPLSFARGNLASNRQAVGTDVYTESAIDMYNYIQENLPEDAVILSGKPRALYLNTGRLGFVPTSSEHNPFDADYCFIGNRMHEYQLETIPEEFRRVMEVEYASNDFVLYRILDESDA